MNIWDTVCESAIAIDSHGIFWYDHCNRVRRVNLAPMPGDANLWQPSTWSPHAWMTRWQGPLCVWDDVPIICLTVNWMNSWIFRIPSKSSNITNPGTQKCHRSGFTSQEASKSCFSKVLSKHLTLGAARICQVAGFGEKLWVENKHERMFIMFGANFWCVALQHPMQNKTKHNYSLSSKYQDKLVHDSRYSSF